MNTPFFIARRYLFAKKSHNLINLITWISVIGIGVASFALIVVLSAFNGLEDVIGAMNQRLSPDLEITAAKGKTIQLKDFPSETIRGMKDVDAVVPVITEDALFRTSDKQHIGQVKGVGPEYERIQRLQEVAFQRDGLVLSDGQHNFAIPGAGVAWHLGINAYDPYAMLRIYVPKRGKASSFSIENSFSSDVLTVTSVFSTEQEMDEKVVLVPYQWLADMEEYHEEATSMEVFVNNSNIKNLKKELKSLLGKDYIIKDHYEQQATLYKVMHSEKWAVYAILTFILILATFNVTGSLSMLIVEKQKDTEILRAMGADKLFIKRTFMNEGLLIAVAGGLIGLLLGIVLVLLQQRFGFIKFGTGGNYIVDAYPVALKALDIITIFFTLLVIGGSAAYLTVNKALTVKNPL